MEKRIKLAGASGREYAFSRADVSAPWARNAGVVVFAAPDTYGWRVISIIELTGRLHDVRPFWALRDAERYGARAVFLSIETDRVNRLEMMQDLEAGFCPVVGHAPEQSVPLAA